MGHRRAREDKGERSRKLRKKEVSKREPSFQVLQRSWLRNTEAHPLGFFFFFDYWEGSRNTEARIQGSGEAGRRYDKRHCFKNLCCEERVTL